MKIEITDEQLRRLGEAMAEEGVDNFCTEKDLQVFIDRLISNYLGDL
jgi:hypothetical protein